MYSISTRTAALGLALAFVATPAGAEPVPPPAGAISDTFTYLGNIPEMTQTISLAFLDDVMFVSANTGVFSYDVSDPTHPALLGALPQYIWANEDVNIDPERELLFVSREPGFLPQGGGAAPYGAVEIVDVSDPRVLRPISFTLTPGGHTATCIDHCRYLWLGSWLTGPEVSAWNARPVHALDVTDPAAPKLCPGQIDTERDDGVTRRVHDVQEDPLGIAWVSGAGGVRGYWTSGEHLDPVTGQIRVATGCDPIPYAGGGTPTEATPSRFMHNAWREPSASVDGRAGDVLWATEESFGGCAQTGRLTTYDLAGSYAGEGWRSTPGQPFRMKVLDTWTPAQQEGSTACDSAHNFTVHGSKQLIAQGFFTQGTRILDMSDPRDIRQVGYFRPDDANAWQAVWHGDLVFVADNSRGIDILRFTGSTSTEAVVAPSGGPRVASTAIDQRWSGMCRIPARGSAGSS